MSLIGTYSVSGSTVSVSQEFSTVDELLLGLLDNNAGAIDAYNVRDVAYTLWQKIDAFSASLASSGSASVLYSSSTPSYYPGNVGGVPQGSTFSGSVQQVLDRIFYPYVQPTPEIQPIGSGILEFGSPVNITLSYDVTLGSNQLIPASLLVDGVPKIFPPYSGSHNSLATHSVSPITASESNTFIISVSDGTNVVTGTQTLYWQNKIYWGRVDFTSVGNPNLTLYPGSASTVAALCGDSVIINLTGAGANGVLFGEEFAVVKEKYYANIDGSGEYLIFAWPSTFPNSNSPTFTVNGIVNTAFTNVRTSSPLTNSQGFSGTDYEVWVSNTIYHSPVDIEIS
ncbi:hypothetical protein EBU95_20075 [bacterium]|nr:hypothetical protein [bacterium]